MEPVVRKNYAALHKGSSFQREAYWLIAKPSLVLVQYIGDETTFIPQTHGNAKKTTRPYYRTSKSVLNAQKKNDVGRHIETYKKQIAVPCPPGNIPVLHPRNYRQVVNSN